VCKIDIWKQRKYRPVFALHIQFISAEGARAETASFCCRSLYRHDGLPLKELVVERHASASGDRAVDQVLLLNWWGAVDQVLLLNGWGAVDQVLLLNGS